MRTNTIYRSSISLLNTQPAILDDLETVYTDELASEYDEIITILDESDLSKYLDKNVLFVINLGTKTPDLGIYQWIDTEFGTLIKNLLTPKKSRMKWLPRLRCTFVKGAGQLPLASSAKHKLPIPYADKIWPLKFPPGESTSNKSKN